MPDPLKLQVLKALTEHLEGIQGPDWGDFDLRGCVFRGRNRFGEDMPETFLSLLEAPRNDAGRETGEFGAEARSYEWPILLQGWTKDDPINPTDPVYHLQEVVERRLRMIIASHSGSGFPLYPEVWLLGRRITKFDCGPGIVRPPTDNLSSKAFLYLPIRIGLAQSSV